MAKEKLVGSDGKLVQVVLGSEYEGDGVDTLDEHAGGSDGGGAGEGWYQITEISDGTSAFATGLVVGDLFWDDGSMVLADASVTDKDKVKPLTETELAYIQSFSIEMSKAEIDVTTLADDTRVYRGGKTDMTGSLEGITKLGETDSDGGILNRFVRIIAQASAGTVTVSEIDDSDMLIKGVVQKDTDSGEKESFLWAKVTILGTSLGASGEDAQSFSSSFRIAPGDPAPTFYTRVVA